MADKKTKHNENKSELNKVQKKAREKISDAVYRKRLESSDALTRSLYGNEGFRDYIYKDNQGYWTFGYGDLLSMDKNLSYIGAVAILKKEYGDDVFTMTLEKKEDIANRKSQEHIAKDKSALKKHFGKKWDTLTPDQKDSLTEMTYQMGMENVQGFNKFKAALDKGDYGAASYELLNSDWFKQTPDRAIRLASKFAGQDLSSVANKGGIGTSEQFQTLINDGDKTDTEGTAGTDTEGMVDIKSEVTADDINAEVQKSLGIVPNTGAATNAGGSNTGTTVTRDNEVIPRLTPKTASAQLNSKAKVNLDPNGSRSSSNLKPEVANQISIADLQGLTKEEREAYYNANFINPQTREMFESKINEAAGSRFDPEGGALADSTLTPPVAPPADSLTPSGSGAVADSLSADRILSDEEIARVEQLHKDGVLTDSSTTEEILDALDKDTAAAVDTQQASDNLNQKNQERIAAQVASDVQAAADMEEMSSYGATSNPNVSSGITTEFTRGPNRTPPESFDVYTREPTAEDLEYIQDFYSNGTADDNTSQEDLMGMVDEAIADKAAAAENKASHEDLSKELDAVTAELDADEQTAANQLNKANQKKAAAIAAKAAADAKTDAANKSAAASQTSVDDLKGMTEAQRTEYYNKHNFTERTRGHFEFQISKITAKKQSAEDAAYQARVTETEGVGAVSSGELDALTTELDADERAAAKAKAAEEAAAKAAADVTAEEADATAEETDATTEEAAAKVAADAAAEEDAYINSLDNAAMVGQGMEASKLFANVRRLSRNNATKPPEEIMPGTTPLLSYQNKMADFGEIDKGTAAAMAQVRAQGGNSSALNAIYRSSLSAKNQMTLGTNEENRKGRLSTESANAGIISRNNELTYNARVLNAQNNAKFATMKGQANDAITSSIFDNVTNAYNYRTAKADSIEKRRLSTLERDDDLAYQALVLAEQKRINDYNMNH